MVEEGLQPIAEALLRPLRIVVVADRLRGAGRSRRRSRPRATRARRGPRSPARMSCCSRLSDTSSARRAEVRIATRRQTTATATITPIGMISRSRAWSQRDRLLSSAMSGCAERFTLPPLADIGGCDHRRKRLRFACGICGQRVTRPWLKSPRKLTRRKPERSNLGRGSVRKRLSRHGSAAFIACCCRAGAECDMGGAQGRRPAFAQVGEIGFARFDAVDQFGVAGVAPHDQKVDRHADAEIRAHGRSRWRQARP